MSTPLRLWRNFGADRDSKRRFPLVISLLAYLFSTLVLTLTLFALSMLGQSRTAQPRSTHAQPAVASVPAPSGGHRDLSAPLADLERVSQATDNDIANLHVEKWGAGWTKAITRSKDANQQQAQQVAASLQRNLRGAMPGLIHDVQNARGTLSTTFKLYDNLSVVCEALDSLITAAESKGKKEESAPLNEDYNALVRLRREFSGYIQAGTVALENKGKLPAYTGAAASGKSGSGPQTVTGPGGVKRIIVDDEVPEKKPAPAQKKKPAAATPNSAATPSSDATGPPAPASAAAPVTARAVKPTAPSTAPAMSAPVAANPVAAAPSAAVAPPPAAAASVTSAPSTSAAAPAPSQMQALAPAANPSPTPKKKATIIYSN